jgi:predicted CopG family antitoxin
MGTNTIIMSKNISISDEVYRRLKREKGDRSFSEVIAAKLDGGGEIAEVTGMQILEPETYETVSEEIERLSEETMRRTTE